jgi:hypothetical protein
MNTDTRYPYTYAADYVRSLAGYGEGGTKLSRGDASQIRQGIAKALGMDDAELARKLADHYKANEEAITEHSAAEFLAAMGR